MGTRGLIGFTADEKDHFVYNHFDSYPDCLGENMVAFVQNNLIVNPDKWAALAKSLKDISGTKPDELSIKRCEPYTDLGVSSQSTDDWYCLLRLTQGDPAAILECGYYEQYDDFIYNSLFCEYAYVINFDTGMLEFYEGFQKTPHDKGRFAKQEDDGNGYYPCALIGEYPFAAIPDNWKDCFLQEDY